MKPILLTILDGFGMRKEIDGNAILQAHLETFNYLWNKYPHSTLEASGESVGLPAGQMGNSEVGHLNIGAGRIVYQPLQLITKSIEDKTFFQNKEMLSTIKHVNEFNSSLHILGLLSDGGVHSHINHILAMIDMAKNNNVKNLYIHIFTDGRDTSPYSSSEYVKTIMEKFESINLGKIATISGRFYAMDRDKKWDRTKLAYDALVDGIGNYNSDVLELIKTSYENNITDEFIVPTIINKEGLIKSNDGILFANFRTDRAPQILAPLTNKDFNEFDHTKVENIDLTMLMPADKIVIGKYAYHIEKMENILGEYLSKNNKTQLRIAETEKYAHVTFFFDGGNHIVYDGCTQTLIPSPKVLTYDLQPEMSAIEVCKKVIEAIDSEKYDFILLNFANPDMVGHTGNIDAAIKAVKKIDELLNSLYKKIEEKEGLMIITADHGNAEYMKDEEGNIITSHTTNKVPFIICNEKYELVDGKLADIAPTILNIMNLEIPKEMTGNILTKEKSN